MTERQFFCNRCDAGLISEDDWHGRVHSGCRRFGVFVENGRELLPVRIPERIEAEIVHDADKHIRARKPKRVGLPRRNVADMKPLVAYKVGDRVSVDLKKLVDQKYRHYTGEIKEPGWSEGQWFVKRDDTGRVELLHNEFLEKRGDHD